MNWQQIEGNWKRMQDRVRQQWGKLTDEDLDEIEGNRHVLSGRIQRIYGISQGEAERQIERFAETLADEPAPGRKTHS